MDPSLINYIIHFKLMSKFKRYVWVWSTIISIGTWLILIRKTYIPSALYGAFRVILDVSYVIEKYNHAIDPLVQDAWHNYGRDKNWPNRECVREGVYCKEPWKKDRFKKQKVIEMITWKTWLEKKVRCVRFLYINCINGIYVLL